MTCPLCGGESKGKKLCGSPRCVAFVKRCIEDPCYFFEHALILRYIKGKPQFFQLMPWQRLFLEYCKSCLDSGEPIRAIVIKGRRIGFSTLVAGFHVWYVVCRAALEGTDKNWDIISASHPQAKKLFRESRRMVRWNPLLFAAVKRERNGILKLGETEVTFTDSAENFEGIVAALSSGGATKRGRSPDGQTFDEAAQISDEDYHDLDISSMGSDDHQIIGSTPYDDFGFFFDLIHTVDSDYVVFKVPTAVLDAEGQSLLNMGEVNKITEKNIIEVTGYRITPEKIIKRLKKYDAVTAKREIFGLFVSGEELYYPGSLVKPCINYEREFFNLTYETPNLAKLVDDMIPDIQEIKIGVDMAGQGHHKTVVTVFAIQKNNAAHMIYGESWQRVKYPDQYREIERIGSCFTGPKWSEARYFVDSTGTQDSNVDSLRALGLDVVGVLFSPQRIPNYAKILYEYFMRGRESKGTYFSLMYDEVMYRELLSVRADYKGEKGHLGDWVASIWCALSEQTNFIEEEVTKYDNSGPNLEAAEVNRMIE